MRQLQTLIDRLGDPYLLNLEKEIKQFRNSDDVDVFIKISNKRQERRMGSSIVMKGNTLDLYLYILLTAMHARILTQTVQKTKPISIWV